MRGAQRGGVIQPIANHQDAVTCIGQHVDMVCFILRTHLALRLDPAKGFGQLAGRPVRVTRQDARGKGGVRSPARLGAASRNSATGLRGRCRF